MTELTQVFSCEFCETFKNTFFYRTLPVTASAIRFADDTCLGYIQEKKDDRIFNTDLKLMTQKRNL